MPMFNLPSRYRSVSVLEYSRVSETRTDKLLLYIDYDTPFLRFQCDIKILPTACNFMRALTNYIHEMEESWALL